MKKIVFFTVLLFIGKVAYSEEYTDSDMGIVYTLNPERSTAMVKSGNVITWEKDYEYTAGSPEAKGNVAIPDKITVGCKSYTVTEIGDYAFVKLTGLISVTIPPTVTSVGREAFAGCTALEAISMYEGTKEICQEAFSGCTALKTLVLPAGLMSIGFGSFCNCQSLDAIIIPKSVTGIDVTSFEGCDALSAIAVEGGNVVYDSREECNAIVETNTNTLVFGCKKSRIPSSVRVIGPRAFLACKGLQRISIPGSVVEIGENAFQDCTQLKSVTLADGLKKIGLNAFRGCDLSELTIPASVESIGESALWMAGLKSLTSMKEYPVTMDDICNQNYTNTVLFVPKGAMARYETLFPWNRFQNIEEIDTTGIPFAERGTLIATDPVAIDLKGHRLMQHSNNGIYVKSGRKFVAK